MTVTVDTKINWLPRAFVAQSIQSDRASFEQMFEGTLFLLIKLKDFCDPLAVGLQQVSTEPQLGGVVLAPVAPTEFATAGAAFRAETAQMLDDSIITAMALEPRFVVPIRKRVTDGSDAISVGRSYASDVVLREPSVSKLHAHFESGPVGWTVVDRDSKNHTRINGEILRGKRLVRAGCTLQFGRVEAKVCSAAALWKRIASAPPHSVGRGRA